MPTTTTKIWTAKHSGDMDLLRSCLADPSMTQWAEESRPDPKHGRKCRVAWVDRHSISGISRINYKSDLGQHTVISRLEGMREVADKAETERALERCRLIGMPGFEAGASSYFPQTWRLPEQLNEFRTYVHERRVQTKKGKRTPTFIVKPSGGSEGNGIVLLRHERNVPRYVVPTKPAVAQSYIAPLLVDGKKFDLRLYVLVRSVDPLEVYIHKEGLARFCTEDYEAPSDANLQKAYAHLTNYSLNKRNANGFVHMSQADVDARQQAVQSRAQAADEDDDDEESEGEGAPSIASSHSFLEARAALKLSGGGRVAIGDGNDEEEETEAPGDGDGPSASASSDDDDDDDGDDEDDDGPQENVFAFEGCSKRPVSVVLRELDEAGIIDADVLWDEIKHLTALTCVALQPEVAKAYRNNFPDGRTTPMDPSEAAEPADESTSANRHRAFHVLGIDILIDKKGKPRLLELNSNPSMAIDFECDDGEGHTLHEPSPVDILVKRRVVTDVLRHVANKGDRGLGSSGRATFLEAVIGGDERPIPREWTLLDRCRRVFTAANPVQRGGAGMTSSQFVRFARSSGIFGLSGLTKADLELLFIRLGAEQYDARSMNIHTFTRALAEIADLAFASLDHRGERVEALLSHIAAGSAGGGAGLSATGTGSGTGPGTGATSRSRPPTALTRTSEPGGEEAPPSMERRGSADADGRAERAATCSTAREAPLSARRQRPADGASPRATEGSASTLGPVAACKGCGEAQHLERAVFCHRCGARM